MNIGWRPHDLETAYLPFGFGVGIEVGRSDPVFMAKHGLQPVLDNHPVFPFDPAAMTKQFKEGDEKVALEMKLGKSWLMETNSGLYRTWEDTRFLRKNWEGPLILKGIQHVEVRVFLVVLWVRYTNTHVFLGRGKMPRVWHRWDHRL